MPKRQTETKIWTTQRWYKKLHPYYKLVWKYLTDCCDHAGIWKIDYGQLVDDTGIEDFVLVDFLQACNTDFDKETGEKIFRQRIVNRSGVLWLTGFIKFQYENKDFQVNPEVPVVKSALQILQGYGILSEALEKGYITLSKPFGKGAQTLFEPPAIPKIEKNDANAPIVEVTEPEKLPENLSEPFNNPLITLTEPFNNPMIRGVEGLKNKEQRTPLGTKKIRDSEEDIEKKSNLEESKRGLVVELPERDVGLQSDVEKYFSAHQAEYEAICMSLRKNGDFAKQSLRKYHLHLDEKQLYPMPGHALRSGFEKWLMNEKIPANGKTSGLTPTGSPVVQTNVGGTSRKPWRH